MRREDCVEVFGRIPESIHASTNIVLKNAVQIAIDTVIRFEPSYILVRGREGGTTDEGRSFFVTYDDIAYIKIEKVLRALELRRLYGESLEVDVETTVEDGSENVKETMPTVSDVVTPTPAPSAPMDPAAIAKQNLLDRIRAARTSTLSGIRSGR